MTRRLGPILLGALALILIVAVGIQLLLPGWTASRIEDRLTRSGGEAQVSVDALPAARLLFGNGDEISVRGAGLELDLDEEVEPRVFERLDGFEEVDVALRDFRAGPFAVARFELTRSGPGPYRLLAGSTTTAADAAEYGAASLGVPGGPLLDVLADGLPEAKRPIAVELDMELTSDQGRVVVTSGGGSVAGLPTGPLAQLITEAIVVRL